MSKVIIYKRMSLVFFQTGLTQKQP